ncbi:MAG: cyclase/dehydrase [Edaphobacter sp.]|nr:cyclase/dehydrase [Edaphobacter sp.]
MSNDARSSSSQSVSQFGVIAGASALVLYGLFRRNKTGLALATAGGLVAYKQARSHAQNSKEAATAVFRVNATAKEAYRLWRNFENLPRFMAHLSAVRVVDDRHSEWTAKGPLDSRVRWNAEITEDEPSRRIAWRSLPDSQLETSGWVEFRDDPHGRGSLVRAQVEYSNPLGAVGTGLLTVLGKNPTFVVKEDLRRFKALLEAGETPTTVGQTHGPRGLHGHAEQVLFRETSNHPSPQAANEPSRSHAAA